jgi:effector-binding domain-containing protein
MTVGMGIQLGHGERLLIASSHHHSGVEPLMQEYFQATVSIAGAYGFSPVGALEVVEADAGSFKPNDIVGFYSFPSQEAEERFENDPRWPAMRNRRPEIWSEFLPLQVSPKSLSNLTVILHSDMYENVNVDIEVGYVLQDPLEGSLDLSDERTLRTRQLPGAETAATIFRFGKYENSLKSYCAIGTWIEKNGYQIVGPGREVSLRLPPPDKPDEAVTEIQFPVQRRASTHFISPSE